MTEREAFEEEYKGKMVLANAEWLKQYKELRQHERHKTTAETYYWLNQYKLFIESILNQGEKE